jgi:hypothetical protein
MAVGNEALESSKRNYVWKQNINMAAGYMECILYVKIYKQGEDVNSEGTTGMLILYSDCKY